MSRVFDVAVPGVRTGEYVDRIDNADELLENFLETFHDEPSSVQLQLLTATVKLFLKRPASSQSLVTKVLKMSTEETFNPDLRDRGKTQRDAERASEGERFAFFPEVLRSRDVLKCIYTRHASDGEAVSFRLERRTGGRICLVSFLSSTGDYQPFFFILSSAFSCIVWLVLGINVHS